jgi:copper chaperone NosL
MHYTTGNRLSITSRIIVAIASGALIAVFFLPAWRIDLFAPQYPEGLVMNIWINKLTGDIDIINGLNHYIGMKKMSTEMFPEFRYLPYVVAFYLLLGMLVAITGKRKWLFAYVLLCVTGGALALYDFYQWGKTYGSNLDPAAPIQVPGLSYRPPLIGHKRLLNFDAYSFPDAGGWIVIAAGTLAFLVWLVEWYRHRKTKQSISSVLALCCAVVLFPSCHTKPEPFVLGKDVCYTCKMGFTDYRFGGEVITVKGKLYKFDDIICMIQFLKSGIVEEKEIKQTIVVDFNNPGKFINTTEAFFAASPQLKSPMGSNAAAFHTLAAARETSGMLTNWQELYNKVTVK